MESNYRDGPMGHKNKTSFMLLDSNSVTFKSASYNKPLTHNITL